MNAKSAEWVVESGESPRSHAPRGNARVASVLRSSFLIPRSSLSLRPAFTMVELLVTIVIIGIMAGMVLGALQMARQGAREAATKATIAKLNNIIMQRYESYMTRRVPIQIPTGTSPHDAAVLRLKAIRLLMRAEMPDSLADVTGAPTFPITIAAGVTLAEPALHSIYNANLPTGNDYESAICLYKVVSMGSPEAMEQFNTSEIGTVAVGAQNYPVFIDGWGTPICWLRWAPGFNRPNSDIQTGNAGADSDPFDPRKVDVDTTVTPNTPRAFHLIPLVCSAGPDKTFGLNEFPSAGVLGRTTIVGKNGAADFDPATIFDTTLYGTIGGPVASGDVNTHHDNITNHHIEMR